MSNTKSIPSVTVAYAQTGRSATSDEPGMRDMQERAYEKRGEQYLLIKSPPASGKSRVLMFIALDKLHNQGVKQAIVAVPERTIRASFDARKPLRRPRPQRRSAGTHPHRPLLQKRHRTAPSVDIRPAEHGFQ